MGKPLSMDLRARALAAVDEGMSCRGAAVRFGVAAAKVIRWHDQRRSTGTYAAKPQGGDTGSRRGDPRFPKAADPEEVRKHVSALGADGDIFEAINDAEREWRCA